ncbi:hypothetical protein EU545_01620 [Candidatus Thorarchaeota archaeon]|nr:MAG: hypothetical protein EU545_01620 [Candidatus Thorarchaeota archaeon]
MTNYVTRVKVWFYSEGASPSVVMTKLMDLGFRPIRGAYDFIYEHSDEDTNETDLGSAILEIGNALHATLSGFRVLYTLDTHEASEIPDIIPIEDIDKELEITRRELEEAQKEEE